MRNSVVTACSASDEGRKPSTRPAASTGNSTVQTSVDFQSTVAPRFQRQASTTSVIAASATSSHSVAGTRPAVSAAIDSAPNATSSPCGMKITRVTENTSTRAKAISP